MQPFKYLVPIQIGIALGGGERRVAVHLLQGRCDGSRRLGTTARIEHFPVKVLRGCRRCGLLYADAHSGPQIGDGSGPEGACQAPPGRTGASQAPRFVGG